VVESTGCAVNATIPLEGVNFRSNSHELTDDARRVLDHVAGILSRNADIRVEVAGHTDSQGDAAYNQRLSRQRAQAVRDYLISRGLGPEKVAARGYGAQQPVSDNATVEGLGRNRRVELRSLP
jgi:OOP family OmpA-OmpF porin